MKTAPPADTVAHYIHSMNPEWEWDDWFFWPPDVFALTSTLFQLTGCYRVVLWSDTLKFKDGSDWKLLWLNRDWQSAIEEVSLEWMKDIEVFLADGEKPSFDYKFEIGNDYASTLKSIIAELQEFSEKTTLNDLRIIRETFWSRGEDAPNLSNDQKEKIKAQREKLENAAHLSRILIILNAICDQSGRGLGLPYASNQEGALAEFYGNLLLTTYGSLSTLPKHMGIVLPKMRTPQSGLTPRGLSHHITFHISEVEVMWRTIPWPNQIENTLNILCFPLPANVDDEAFIAEPERFQSVRYFGYETPKDRRKKALVAEILEQLMESEKEVTSVQFLVFPEMGLTNEEFDHLLVCLSQAHRGGKLDHVPFVISGVRNSNGVRVTNEVRLAAYFAGSWYTTMQRKHHRWKLDGYQIRQYKLEGRLPTTRSWFEDIPIMQRRITFIAPNDWLALCPLICEDLAQLEPVASIIRGVGPTLLFALLFDGPQLKNRWPARYASVLADDPGTAVLTLTSLGMAKRSLKIDSEALDSSQTKEVIPEKVWTAGLWRDQVKGWYPINLRDNQESFLLTLAADWKEELALDGRSDKYQAARFRFEGCRPYDKKSAEHTTMRLPYSGLDSRTATWTDFREFSALIFAIDTLISLDGDYSEEICRWLLPDTPQLTPEEKNALSNGQRRRQQIFDILYQAQLNPYLVGVDAEEDIPWGSESFQDAIKEIQQRSFNIGLNSTDPHECVVGNWRKLFDSVIDRMKSEQLTSARWSDANDNKKCGNCLFFYDEGSWKPTTRGVSYQISMITLQNISFRLDEQINVSRIYSESRSYYTSPPSNFAKKPHLVKNIQDAAQLLKEVSNALQEYSR